MGAMTAAGDRAGGFHTGPRRGRMHGQGRTAMAAYLIANIRVTDPARFVEYRDKVAPLIARYGGRYVIRGGAVAPVEGEPGLDRVVVLEFADMAALRRFYHSDDYAPLIALRQAASTGDVALVEGYAPPG